MAAACPGDLSGVRDRALLRLFSTGLNRATLVGLDVEHVRFNSTAVEFPSGSRAPRTEPAVPPSCAERTVAPRTANNQVQGEEE